MKYKILILQRSMPHYREEFFRALNSIENFKFSFGFGNFNPKTSTGIESNNRSRLDIIDAPVKHFWGNLLWQKVIPIKNYDALVLDVSINMISSLFYILKAKFLGVKIIAWGKGIPQGSIENEAWYKKMLKKLVAHVVDSMALYGDVSLKYYENLGIEKDKLFVARNTTSTNLLIKDEDLFMQISRKRFNIEKRKFVYGYFGRLTERKGVLEILDAFKLCHEEAEDKSVLIIAGNGPLHNRLKEKILELELESSVLLITNIPSGEEGVILYMFDAFLNYQEGGLGVIQALAAKSLVISNKEDYPETEMLKDGFNCIISAKLDIVSFSKAMLKAMKEDHQIKRENGRKTVVQTYKVSDMVDGFIGALNYSLKE